MKILKIKNSIKKEDGFFPLPKNLTNRIMFCYPVDSNLNSKYFVKNYYEEKKRKINAIVAYYGEFFNGKNWHIGLMGIDTMILYDENLNEYNIYFSEYVYNDGKVIYHLENEEDTIYYIKNKKVFERYEKIQKIINYE